MGHNVEPSLTAYVNVIRRHKWIVICAVLVTTASAAFFSSRQGTLYQANATVLLNPDASLIGGAGNSPSDAQARFDEGQAQIAHGPAVAAMVVKTVNRSGLSPVGLIRTSQVSSDPVSNILTFSVRDPSKTAAQRLANAYVGAYTRFSIGQITENLTAGIADETAAINRLTQRMATVSPSNTGQLSTIRAALNSHVVQRGLYQEQLNTATRGGPQLAKPADGAVRVSPNLPKYLVLGLIAGLVIGIMAAFLREALDSHVRSVDELASGLNLRLLARIPTPSKRVRSKNGLAMLGAGTDVDTEPYRKLRAAFDFANVKVQARSVMVTSALEQEGKSTTVANLAVALSNTGRRVVLIDLDLRRPYLAKLFGLDDSHPGVVDVLSGGVSLSEALVDVTHLVPGNARLSPSQERHGSGALAVIGAGRHASDSAQFLEAQELPALLDELVRRADVVLIDAPPLLPVADGLAISQHVDAVFVVAQPALLTRATLSEFRRLLDLVQVPTLGFVLARCETGRLIRVRVRV